MGIPYDLAIWFMTVSILLLLITIILLFREPDFNAAIAAMIICFINVVLSFSAAYSLFVTNIYGFTTSGTLVENNTTDLLPFGMIFLIFGYISLVFVFYAIFLCYKKPWEEAVKSYGKRLYWYEQ